MWFLAVSTVEGCIKGTTLQDNSRMHNSCANVLNSLNSNDFKKMFIEWQDYMRSRLAVQGAYFEKDVQTLNLTGDSK